ncbi:MAG: polysaccharide deacetylase family protein [Methanobacterium sp.]
MKLLEINDKITSKFSNSNVAIITYHRVSNKCDDWSLNPLPVNSFKDHIKFLTETYNIISLNDLVDSIIKREPIPQRSVILTFDDGYKDNYVNAYPLLKKYEIPATIFLTTKHIGSGELPWNDKVGYIIYNTPLNQIKIDEIGDYPIDSKFRKYQAFSEIKKKLIKCNEIEKSSLIKKLANFCHINVPLEIGNELMLSWDEVIEMDENGVDFGAHTVNHPILTNININDAKWEILQSKKVIEEKIGKQVNSFSYPYGNFNQNISDMIQELNFKCAVTLNQKLINTGNDELYSLGRIDGFEDLSFLKLFLSGYGKYFYNFVKLKNQIITNNPLFYKKIMEKY